MANCGQNLQNENHDLPQELLIRPRE